MITQAYPLQCVRHSSGFLGLSKVKFKKKKFNRGHTSKKKNVELGEISSAHSL